MAGNTFAMEAMTFLTSALVDRKAGDLRIETAMCKMWATEMTWRIADDAMQVRGGRGYETAQSLAAAAKSRSRWSVSCAIAASTLIFEGSSEIMRLFIAREALDPHLKVGGAIFNTQLPMSTRAKSIFSSGKFYAALVSEAVDSAAARAISTSCTPICGAHVELRRARRASDWRAVCSTP